MLPLWQYFQKVIGWVKATFPKYRREMKGVDWGVLYNQFKDKEYDTDRLEKQVAKLMQDDDVEKKSGIYPYVLDGDERHLNIRAFPENMKREAYERQKGVCVKCKKKFAFEEMESVTSSLGTRAGRPTRRTARCCVRTTTEENREDERGLTRAWSTTFHPPRTSGETRVTLVVTLSFHR